MEEQKKKLKLFIMDDSDIFRAGLVEILKQEELEEEDRAFDLCGCGEHSDEAEELCMAAAPDVLLVHASTRETDKHLQIAGRVKKRAEGTRILAIAEFSDFDYLLKIVASGCDGYVHSSIPGRSLTKILRNLGNDVCIFDRMVIEKLLLLEDERRSAGRMDFSPRERRIAEMLAEGKNNAVIGKELKLSAGTVKNLISDLLKRHHFKSRAQLVSVLLSL
ncbi:MAG: response regulator transcription factor [Synergistaceae bacterium]|jgi:DNA-binding NarL/FixJ family response regulator|nr:response regulator transcription factor [Synergistaceae bacterium]